MSKFLLAREDPKKGKLPGTPIAVVKSSNPALNKLFLCTVVQDDTYKGAGLSDSDSESESDTDVKPNIKADIRSELKRVPHAKIAAEKYKEEEEGGTLAGHKRRRGGEKEKEKEKAKPKKFSDPSELVDFIRLPLGAVFEPLPQTDPEKRRVDYMAGKSGSGKSYAGAGLARKFKKLYPDRPIYGFCKTKFADDPAYADLGILQLPMSFFAGAGAMDLEKCFGGDGCLILFDDWDSMENSDIKLLTGVIKDVLNVGRKLKLSCIITSHLLTNYMQTRGIIHEADWITIFPQSCQRNSMQYLCDKLGVPKDVTCRLKAKGRWVSIHNSNPVCVLSETEAEMM